jgi:nucleotide-binding universal stress UspA family protein
MARARAHREEFTMYRRWLVAHDFEPCAEAAADAAARVAFACRRDGTEPPTLIIAHVVTPPALPMNSDVAGGVNVLAVIDLMIKTAKERLEAARAKLATLHPDVKVETVVLSGSPVEALLDAADTHRVDAIAVGSHGRTGLAHAFLGSVAERLAQRSSRPVLVVKQAPEPVLAA